MLVLSRKPGQSVKIELEEELPWKTPVGLLFADGPIEIIITQVNGQQVKLGIVAHPDLKILRDDLDACDNEEAGADGGGTAKKGLINS